MFREYATGPATTGPVALLCTLVDRPGRAHARVASVEGRERDAPRVYRNAASRHAGRLPATPRPLLFRSLSARRIGALGVKGQLIGDLMTEGQLIGDLMTEDQLIGEHWTSPVSFPRSRRRKSSRACI